MKKFTYVLAVLLVSVFSWQGVAQTFTGATGAVPDNACPTLTPYIATVTGVGVLGGTNVFDQVEITINHTWGSDLNVFLTAPDGTTQVELTTGNGGNGTQYVNTIFRADAGASITTGSGDFTGTWLPEGNLAGFDGVLADGDWTLDVCDSAGGDTGAVNLFEITFAPAPSCFTPSALTASNITPTQADLSWTAGGTETAWNIEWGLNPLTQGAGTTINGVTNPYTLTGLTANTSYDYYVQADCGLGGVSTWTGPYTLFTGYCASVPTSNDGAGISNVQLGATDFPTGDVTYFDHTGTVIDIAQSTIANLQITFETGYTYDTNVWIDLNDNLVFEASEQVFDGASLGDNPTTLDASFNVDAAAALGNHRMRIGTADTGQATPDPCYNGSYGVTLDFTVNVTVPPNCLPPLNLTVTNVNSATGTADIGWTDANAPSNDFTYSIEDITNGINFTPNTLSGGATTVAITGLVAGNDYTFSVFSNCGLDTSTVTGPFAWNQTNLPDCVTYTFPLDGATDVIGGITPLTWTEPGTGTDPTGYDIYFGQTSGALTNLGNIPFPATAVNITGILANTTYYWMIVPVNAGGENQSCGEFSFTTAAAPTAPVGVTCTIDDPFNAFTEEFDTQGTWTGDIGTGNGVWNFGRTGGTPSGSTGPSAAHSGTNYMYFEASSQDGSIALANSPAIDLTGASEGAELSFFLHAFGTGIGRLDVLVSTDGGTTYTYEDSWGAQLQTADTDAWVPMGVNLDAYLGQTINIQLRYISTNSFTGDMAIDLFEVNTCQTIACPAPLNLAITNISTATVDIAWDIEANAINYDWEIQPSGNAQGDPGVINSGTNEVSNGLLGVTGPFIPGADYTLYVRSNCGGSNSSYSSATFSIPPGAEDCANVIDLGTLTSPYSSTTAGAINDFVVDCLTNVGAPDRIYSVLVPDGYTLVIGQTSNDYDSKHRLAYGGACPGTTLIDCVDDPDIGNITWTNTTGVDETTYWIQSAFSTGSGNFTLAWTLTPPPTCFPPANLAVTNISTGGADLSWDAATPVPVDGYYWEIQPQGSPQGDIAMIDSGTTASGVITATTAATLVAGDSYTLYVNSVCALGVDESTFTSVDFTVPFNGACGLYSNFPGIAIPDNDTIGITDTMSISDGVPGEVLLDLNVYIGITHTWSGDLDITLTSPSGTSVVLFNSCGSEDNLDIEFDDAGGAIVCGTGGIYQPDNPLSAFNGKTWNGDWSLTVTDNGNGDTGTLDQWCLIPTLGPNPLCGGTTWTWSAGAWDQLGVPGPTDTVIIDSFYETGTNGSIDACTLKLNNGVFLTVNNGTYVSLVSNAEIEGVLIIDNDASFVQIDGAAATTKLTGATIDVLKQTTIYTSVGFSILGNPMTGGDRAGLYDADASVSWVRSHNTANFAPHPGVESTFPGIQNWADDNGDNWNEIAGTDPIVPGAGYLVGGVAVNGNTITTTYNQGTLNSGDITFTPLFNTSPNDSPNILSNPYASGLDINSFLVANPDAGTSVYFWEHLFAPSNAIPGYNANMNYSMGDISFHNGVTGNAAANGGAVPGDFIPSGQGFGMKVTVATPITFTNAMRSITNTGYRAVEKDELHLIVKNEAYNLKGNTAIGFTSFTDDGIDSYDSKRLGTFVSLYTLDADMSMEMGIQMRSSFTIDQVIALGFSTLVEEDQTYTISIREIEGAMIEQADVYLIDNTLNITTNLSEMDYTFTSNAIDQKDRFVIVFSDNQLGNSDSNLSAISVYPNPTKNILNIVSPVSKVNNVVVHDISGRKVATYDFTNNLETKLDVTSYNSGVYFVEINTVDGSVTKRIIRE